MQATNNFTVKLHAKQWHKLQRFLAVC